MSIASMAAALEEKRKQREAEEELALTGKQTGEEPAGFASLQEAAEMLDKILTEQGIAVPTVQASANAVMNAAAANVTPNTSVPLPWWNDQHPARLNMKQIQNSLRQERVNQHLTQRELAVKASMSQGSVARAEKNGWISITTLLRIANALGKEIILN